ncbi:hypothetical protein U9873_23820 [Escherichia coli]
MNKVFIFLIFLLFSKLTMADITSYPTHDVKIAVSNSVNASDAPGTWLNLGKINIGTDESLNSSLSPCGSTAGMCTAGQVKMNWLGDAKFKIYLIRTPKTITDTAGNSYILTVAFPSKEPVAGIYELNRQGGHTYNYGLNFDGGSDISQPSETVDSVFINLRKVKGYCGNAAGCPYTIGSFIHTNSGMPSVYVKIPSNISARKITFQNVQVLELQLTAYGTSETSGTPTTAKLYLSGTISVPQRCYINVDKYSFDFGTIYSNVGNGVLKNNSATITTDCYYAPNDTKQYLKMEAISGGTLDTNSKVYLIGSDSALGIVFNINNNPLCEQTTNEQDKFNTEYLMRTITYQAHAKESDIVNFALCKYGVPSVTGQKNISLKLTSRWVVN